MLKYSKISKYKIKKILRHFVADDTSTETAEILKLNRHTIDRYYNIFRKIIKLILSELLLESDIHAEYIGYVKGEYNENVYLDIYRYRERLFLFNILYKEPTFKKPALKNESFLPLAKYFYSRYSKSRGFTKKGYTTQLIETSLRYYYNDADDLFSAINNRLKIPLKRIY